MMVHNRARGHRHHLTVSREIGDLTEIQEVEDIPESALGIASPIIQSPLNQDDLGREAIVAQRNYSAL